MKGNVEMFPLLEEFVEENELQGLDNTRGAIATHLRSLFDHFAKYFKEETTLQHYWIRQPFSANGSHHQIWRIHCLNFRVIEPYG